MDQKSLEDSLSGLPMKRISYFDSVGSTSDVAADWARNGLRGIALVVADEQTSGRGRAGRRWLTPASSALAFSLLMPFADLGDLGKLARTAGLPSLAVCQSLEQLYKLSPKIKWPNDVLLNGKKLCGVLAEAHWSGDELQALIFGIGINIAPASVPQERDLNFPATCLEEELGQPVERLQLLRSALERLLALVENFQEDTFIGAWESRLAFKDKTVRLKDRAETSFDGRVLGLDREGRLKLKMASNETRVFQAGEIQLRPIVDSNV